jgi:hypothetical protein
MDGREECRRRRREKNITRGTGVPVKKWKDIEQKEDG